MTETFHKTKNYKIDHSTFGGLIFHSDFNTDYRGKNNDYGSPIAKRIIQDNNFDTQCKKNLIYKLNYGGIKND